MFQVSSVTCPTSTLNTWHLTLDTRHLTLDTRHLALDTLGKRLMEITR